MKRNPKEIPIMQSLSEAQQKELNVRLKSFHSKPSMGRTWDEVKARLQIRK